MHIVTIIGRPNVGKSTFFNIATKSFRAIISKQAGSTRDLNIAPVHHYNGRSFSLIDTSGLDETSDLHPAEINLATISKAFDAVRDSSVVLFFVDAKDGLVADDYKIATQLRKINPRKIYLIINKADSKSHDVLTSEFIDLGFKDIFCISASHKQGIDELIESLFDEIEILDPLNGKLNKEADALAEINAVKELELITFAIIGKPNVGKSTFVNSLLEENRQVVSNFAGTTRDSIRIPFYKKDRKYVMIDTAGVTRNRKGSLLEKDMQSQVRDAIHEATVIVYMIDSSIGVTDQDLQLIGNIIEANRSIVIALNKSDLISADDKNKLNDLLERRLKFASFIKYFYISALKNLGLNRLLNVIEEAYQVNNTEYKTSYLSKILALAVQKHPIPSSGRYRSKLKFAHATGIGFRQKIVIHGTKITAIPNNYKQYLTNFFREHLKVMHKNLLISFKESHNPYIDDQR